MKFLSMRRISVAMTVSALDPQKIGPPDFRAAKSSVSGTLDGISGPSPSHLRCLAYSFFYRTLLVARETLDVTQPYSKLLSTSRSPNTNRAGRSLDYSPATSLPRGTRGFFYYYYYYGGGADDGDAASGSRPKATYRGTQEMVYGTSVWRDRRTSVVFCNRCCPAVLDALRSHGKCVHL
ncbi:hypothetical protein PLICRDRAFT_175725 [Plicaturopsis crispa FD-325 SS-3]|nr:hypothetical protein PLICRDRAFT_175725 [Plicaturopsis crispa FD-325 SS-3]